MCCLFLSPSLPCPIYLTHIFTHNSIVLSIFVSVRLSISSSSSSSSFSLSLFLSSSSSRNFALVRKHSISFPNSLPPNSSSTQFPSSPVLPPPSDSLSIDLRFHLFVTLLTSLLACLWPRFYNYAYLYRCIPASTVSTLYKSGGKTHAN